MRDRQRKKQFQRTWELLVKRVFDILFSLAGILLFAPLWLLIGGGV